MKHVLLTDDEKSFLTSLREGLGGDTGPYRISTAENGEQAVEQMETEDIDLLITDLKMPVMDGFELLAWVSTNRPGLPVIVMTAFGDAELEAKLEQYNTFKCLEKPIDFSVLRGILETALADNTISNIHGVTLSAFLQLMSFDKKSCTLIIKSEGRTGNLYLKNGELTNASYGDTNGMDAAIEILGWDNTEIEMDNVCRSEAILIDNGIESILMEAHRLKDEHDGETIDDSIGGDHHEDDLITEIDDSFADDLDGSNVFEQPFEDEPADIEIEEDVPDHIKEMLVKHVYSHKATEECCLFDHKNLPEQTMTEAKCSQVEFDPAIFLYLSGQLDETIELGNLKWIIFSTTSRHHYLFFRLPGCSLLVKLIRGSRPQLLGAEYMDIVQMVMPNN